MRAVALLVLCAAAPATAEPLAAVARARVDASLPADLAVTELHLASTLARRDVDPDAVVVRWPRPPRAGTTSVELRWGKQRRFVLATLAARVSAPVARRDLAVGDLVTADDVVVEARALAAGARPSADPVGQTVTTAVAAGSVIGDDAVTAPAPLARGTAVRFELRGHGLAVRGRGTLERAASRGQPALVRWRSDLPPARGVLVADDLVVIDGGGP